MHSLSLYIIGLSDAREYLIRFSVANGVIDEERGVQPFFLESIHDFYRDYHRNWDPDTARLLEFGGGPSIYPLISAAPYVSEIVFAEYAEEGRREIELWKNDDPTAHDWTPYFRYNMLHAINITSLHSALLITSLCIILVIPEWT